MKKLFAVLALAAVFGLGACTKATPTVQPGCQASAIAASQPCYNGG